MTGSETSHRAACAGPGEVVECCRDLLPRAVSSHPAFDDVLAYLHGLDADISSFCFYIEWNLREGGIDLTFTFPTTLAGSVRLRFWDLARSLVGPAPGEAKRGRALLEGVCRRLRTLPLEAPLFPRAVSISLGPIGGTEGGGVDLVFLDFGPVLDLGSDPGQLRRAFELLEPPGPLPRQEEPLDVLERVAAGLELAHVGAGWRRGSPLHKAYLRGRLDELVGAVVDRGAAPLIGSHLRDLERLASDAGRHTAHLVLDAAGGSLARVGFELNFDLAGAEGFARLAAADALWLDAVNGELRRDAERLLELGSVGRPLDDGAHARLRVSHLKLSFDGSGRPEWKAYLCFQRSLAG